MTNSRSASDSSACTTCSIQIIVTPRALMRLQLLDQLLRLVLGEAAGDLVEQQQLRPRRQRARQLEPLAVEQRQAAGRLVGVRAAGRSARSTSRAVCQASRSGCPPPKQAAVTRFSNTVMSPKGCGTW